VDGLGGDVVSQSIELADAADALQAQVDGLIGELERTEHVIDRLVWQPNGTCIHCHATKPNHLPKCYARRVLFADRTGSDYGPTRGIQPPTEAIKGGVLL